MIYKSFHGQDISLLGMGNMRLRRRSGPADCIACGAYAEHCPQSIDIPDVMSKLAEAIGV